MSKKCMNMMYFFISFIFLLPLLSIILRSLNYELWKNILNQTSTYESLFTTAIVALVAMVINFIIGTPLAFLMAREKFRGKLIVELLIILPLIIPIMVSTMGLQFAFIKLGLIETTLGVGIIHSTATMPYYIKSMRAGYMTLNKDYTKLGKILGANSIQIFFNISLPLLMPSFIVGMSLVIVVSLAQYLITFIIGGGKILTLSILMMPYLSSGNMGSGIIYSVIYILFTYILVKIFKKIVQIIIYRKRD